MIRDIFTCDVCGDERKPSNGWVMASVKESSLNQSAQVIFFPWDPSKERNKQIKHLCGSDCQSKFLLRITSTWTHSNSGGEHA